ncbi:hypothetical protein [Albibacterium profundi]|uniref:TonB-dependent receptor n=1 Tax=Albibacterium profundi TaxID=3134906 RepID=A0ABV5CEJ4_9SPHI
MKIYSVFLLLFIFYGGSTVDAQTNVKGDNGLSLSGSISDSTRNIRLEAASVALYRQGEDKVHSIALSSRTGRFMLEKLPPQTSFRLQVIHMGYEPFEREIIIVDSSINLGELYLTPRANELEAVEILSPVRMNGDTIEFNADAFHLDSNAVAGDLLTKLPGITIWGDNEITYNGKRINKLYVNGKDFFSTNANIALQNIPKNIIDNVQIFDTDRERRESKNANIVLKKGKDRGIFGKIGAGIGTNKQNELEAIANLFNSSNQLSVGGTKSNINKPLDDIDQLLNNTTFGGISLKVDYFSDLRKKGYHEDSAYGMMFNHNFRDKPSYQMGDHNELKIDLFRKSSNSLTERNINMIRSMSEGADNSSVTKESRHSDFNNFLGNVRYQFKNGQRTDLNISAKFEKRQVDNNRNTSTVGQLYDIETRESDLSREELDESILSLNADLRISSKLRSNWVKWYDHVYFKYDLLYNPSTSIVETDKSIQSSSADFDDRSFLRNSKFNGSIVNQDAYVKLERIFPQKMSGIVDIDIAQRVRLNHNSSDHVVRDSSELNESLTYDEIEYGIVSTSSLSLGRKFMIDELYMRYEKSIGFYSNFDVQVANDDVRSGYSDRNINRTNAFLLPSLRINYLNKVEQNFVKDLSLSWDISYHTPSIGLVAPVVDSINILNQTYGNRDLENSKNNNISLRYIYASFKPTGLHYDLGFHAKFLEDAFVPNISYRNDGRRELYFINDKNVQVNYVASANMRKAFKMSRESNFTAKLSNMGVFSKKGQVIDGDYDKLKSMSYHGKLDLLFNFSDFIKLGVYQQFDFFQQKSRLNADFKSTTSDSNLSFGLGLRKRAFLNTSISYLNVENNSTSDGVLLWNVSASYRALKKRNLEIKLSALDILNNNSSITVNSTSTYTMYETNNIIRRYVMVNLSYYPRFFYY